MYLLLCKGSRFLYKLDLTMKLWMTKMYKFQSMVDLILIRMTARTTFGCWPTRTMVGCWFVGRTLTTRGVGTTQTIRSTRSSPERDFVHTTPGTTQRQFTQVKQTTRLIMKYVMVFEIRVVGFCKKLVDPGHT